MEKFSLIKGLGPEESADNGDPKITYQRYDLPVGDTETGILIPIRECDAFETALEDVEELNEKSLKLLLRTHRGLRIREE